MSRLRLLLGAAALSLTVTTPAVANGGLPSVAAQLETPPVYGDAADRDASADDPAIWVNQRNPEASLVITTKKNAGLQVFDLRGRTVQDIPAPPAPPGADAASRYNNVDMLGDLAVVSDRGRDRIRFFAVSPKGLVNVTAPDVPRVFSATEADVDDQATAYGIATWKAHGRMYAIASQRSRTGIALLEIQPRWDGRYTYRRVAVLNLPSSFRVGRTAWAPCEDPGDLPQVEGMVVDPDNGLLYAGQEDIGIWRIQLRPDGFMKPELIDRTREFGVPATFDPATEECVVTGPDPGFGGTHLSADVEGLTIYGLKGHRGYLLASSQGDDTYAAYADRGQGRYLGSVTIDLGADRVQDSDGADVTPVSLGRAYPFGLLVTQDGFPSTVDPSRDEPSNFKFTPWERFAAAFRPRLAVGD